MKLLLVLQLSAGVVPVLSDFHQKLLGCAVVVFWGVFTHFFALFGVVQHHNQNVKSLMQFARDLNRYRKSRISIYIFYDGRFCIACFFPSNSRQCVRSAILGCPIVLKFPVLC